MSEHLESRYACSCGWAGWESELVAEERNYVNTIRFVCPKCGRVEHTPAGPAFLGEHTRDTEDA